MHVTKILLIFLFFTLPLVHGGIFATLGFDFKLIVSGNFEFTKALFFNIIMSLVFLSFVLEILIHSKFSPLISTHSIFSLQEKGSYKLQPLSPGRRKNVDRGVVGGVIVGGIILLSTLFSLSPFTSLIGDDNKGHTTLLFFNLLGLFFILRNLDKKFLYTLIRTSLLSGVFLSILALKELYFPSFYYGELANRALGSFGHPNYLAGYLLLLLPFTCSLFPFAKERIQVWIRICVIAILCLGILFSKSIVAIVLAFGYLMYYIFNSIPHHKFFSRLNSYNFLLRSNFEIVASLVLSLIFTREMKLHSVCLFGKRGALGGVIVGGLILITLIILYLPEKLHSFLSRFYIWETTLRIIFSDWRIFLFGAGPETLSYLFESYKVPEVYIYENFGFTADRPHNFILNIFYHFGIFGFSALIFFIYKFILVFSQAYKNTRIKAEYITIVLFLLFGIIHFFSIASYIIVILCVAVISHTIPLSKFFLLKGERGYNLQLHFSLWEKIVGGQVERIKRAVSGGFIVLFTLISLIGAYSSIQFYKAELAFAQGNIVQAKEIFSHPKYLIALGNYTEAEVLENIISPQNLKTQIHNSPEKTGELCEKLIQKYPSAENYFYCGEKLENLGDINTSLQYYETGLSYLPDLWNKNSGYWNNYFIKNTITGNRFFSEKFGDINSVLEKINSK